MGSGSGGGEGFEGDVVEDEEGEGEEEAEVEGGMEEAYRRIQEVCDSCESRRHRDCTREGRVIRDERV